MQFPKMMLLYFVPSILLAALSPSLHFVRKRFFLGLLKIYFYIYLRQGPQIAIFEYIFVFGIYLYISGVLPCE